MQLAAREADDWSGAAAVSRLVLAAPPTWADMTTAVPEADLRRNYDALRSPLGDAALGTIESRWAIRTFSDLFLFEGESDEAGLFRQAGGEPGPRPAQRKGSPDSGVARGGGGGLRPATTRAHPGLQRRLAAGALLRAGAHLAAAAHPRAGRQAHSHRRGDRTWGCGG